jgi:biopolymer transport protein ExbD
MIDVLLVLLIIFMMVTMLKPGVLDLQLPEETSAGPPSTPIVLEVLPGPRYVVNGKPTGLFELPGTLEQIYQGRPEKVLYIRGDRTVRYPEIIRAVDIARGAGVRVTGVMLPAPQGVPLSP